MLVDVFLVTVNICHINMLQAASELIVKAYSVRRAISQNRASNTLKSSPRRRRLSSYHEGVTPRAAARYLEEKESNKKSSNKNKQDKTVVPATEWRHTAV